MPTWAEKTGGKKPVQPNSAPQQAGPGTPDPIPVEASAQESAPVSNPVVVSQPHHLQTYNQRISALKRDLTAKLRISEWERQYRDSATKTVKMKFWRRPGVVYAGMCIVMAVMGWFIIFAGLWLVEFLFRLILGGSVDLGFIAFEASVCAVVVPAIITLLYIDSFIEEVQTNEVAIMEWWGRPLEREGLKPLRAKKYLKPPFLFGMKRYEQSKLSQPIAGSDDKTINIPVQGGIDPNIALAEQGQDALSANKISSIEFGGRVNIAMRVDDIRDVILLMDIVGGIKKAADRIAERLISSMRDICCSFNGPQNQAEAIAFNGEAVEVLRLYATEEAIAVGIKIETIAPKIQLPKELRTEVERTNIEKTQRNRFIEDAYTSFLAEFVEATGNKNPTPEELKAFADDPRNQSDANLRKVARLVREDLASKDSIKIINSGGDPLAGIIEKVLGLTKKGEK